MLRGKMPHAPPTATHRLNDTPDTLRSTADRRGRLAGWIIDRQTTEALLRLANECDERRRSCRTKPLSAAEAPPHQKPAVPRTRSGQGRLGAVGAFAKKK